MSTNIEINIKTKEDSEFELTKAWTRESNNKNKITINIKDDDYDFDDEIEESTK